MKKHYLSIALALTVGASLSLSSCIGSFGLTHKVLNWNNQVGNKFVNELVFVAFWILPVYEVTALADLLVINSIEFWSGNNPMEASTRVIDTDTGRYLVECDGHGYTITEQFTGEQTRLDFDAEEQTWSVEIDGEDLPFMTMVDASHVKMIAPDGSMQTVELSQEGLMAYRAMADAPLMAAR